MTLTGSQSDGNDFVSGSKGEWSGRQLKPCGSGRENRSARGTFPIKVPTTQYSPTNEDVGGGKQLKKKKKKTGRRWEEGELAIRAN